MSARRIYLSKQGRDKVKEKFALSSSTVSEILNFKRSNKRAAEVRAYSVNQLRALLIEL